VVSQKPETTQGTYTTTAAAALLLASVPALAASPIRPARPVQFTSIWPIQLTDSIGSGANLTVLYLGIRVYRDLTSCPDPRRPGYALGYPGACLAPGTGELGHRDSACRRTSSAESGGVLTVQLLSAIQQDECAGYPSASEYARLFERRASYPLRRKALALGQVAHERSPAADLGTKKHLASTEGPEMLSEREREDWDIVQAKREEFIKGWAGDQPFSSIKQERLWLRRGIRAAIDRQTGRDSAPGNTLRGPRSKVWQLSGSGSGPTTSNSRFTPCGVKESVLSFRRFTAAAFYLSPLSEFENTVRLRDCWLRAKLLCQSSINRAFTSTNLSRADDLCFILCIFGAITRTKSRPCFEGSGLAFACALGRLILEAGAETGL
jgi:hypothetical protein